MTQFKVGDKVRLVKAREDGKLYDEPDFYNSWEPEMTQRVNNRDEGIIQGIAGTGIRIAGWDHAYPPDSFELVEKAIDNPPQPSDNTFLLNEYIRINYPKDEFLRILINNLKGN